MSFILFAGGIIIGFVVGWIAWGGRASSLSRAVRRYKIKLDQAEAAREPERLALSTVRDRTAALEGELERAAAQIAEARDERWELRRRLALAERALESGEAPQADQPVHSRRLIILEEELAGLRDALEDERKRRETTHSELKAMRAERDSAAGQVVELRAELAAAMIDGEESARPLEIARQAAAAKSRKKPIAKILREAQLSGPPEDDSIDDLTAINGIGPALRRRLQEIGITRFEQIAGLTPEEIGRVDASLDFKGRIGRERWIEQARDIIASR